MLFYKRYDSLLGKWKKIKEEEKMEFKETILEMFRVTWKYYTDAVNELEGVEQSSYDVLIPKVEKPEYVKKLLVAYYQALGDIARYRVEMNGIFELLMVIIICRGYNISGCLL